MKPNGELKIRHDSAIKHDTIMRSQKLIAQLQVRIAQLEEFVDSFLNHPYGQDWLPLVKRAKALLEKGKK